MSTYITEIFTKSIPIFMNYMADLVFYNTRLDVGSGFCAVNQAIAVGGGKILAIGENNDIFDLTGKNIDKINLENNFVLPGFVDSHLHILAGGERLFHPNLRNAATKNEFIALIKNKLNGYKPGEWILGGDWNNENWGGELPKKEWLDDITPNNPVWIKRLDGHMGLANSLALKIAGLDDGVSNITGGEIFREGNKLTGIFKDNAMQLIEDVVPAASSSLKSKYLDAAMSYLAKRGVCSAHHLNLFEDTDIEFFENYKNTNGLKTRLYVSHPLKLKDSDFIKSIKFGKGDDWIRYGIYKGFLDGSLGSQTAAFFNSYKNTQNSGLFINNIEELEWLIERAEKNKVQAAVHAIGDRANHELLNIFEKVIGRCGKRDRRFRIEHAQHIQDADLKRFARMNIIASMQPLHLVDDGCWIDKVLYEKTLSNSYQFNSLLKLKTKLAFGSDWFVTEPSPILGIDAAVNRQTKDGKNPGGWLPNEKISVKQAIDAYTINGAYASFEEHLKGSIEVGKLADFVVLDKNIFTVHPEEIKKTKVLMTVVGGKVVYQG